MAVDQRGADADGPAAARGNARARRRRRRALRDVLTSRFSSGSRALAALTEIFQSAWPTAPIWNGRGSWEVSSRKRKVDVGCASSPISAASPQTQPARIRCTAVEGVLAGCRSSGPATRRILRLVMGTGDTLSRQRRRQRLVGQPHVALPPAPLCLSSSTSVPGTARPRPRRYIGDALFEHFLDRAAAGRIAPGREVTRRRPRCSKRSWVIAAAGDCAAGARATMRRNQTSAQQHAAQTDRAARLLSAAASPAARRRNRRDHPSDCPGRHAHSPRFGVANGRARAANAHRCCVQETFHLVRRLRPGRPNRCSREAGRPGATSGHRTPAASACWSASCAMSLSRRSQRTSGWRRTMPEAVQGASSRMASKGWPSHHSAGRAASADEHLAPSAPSRARVSSMRSAARRVDFQRGDPMHPGRKLQQMGRLAARRRAGIENRAAAHRWRGAHARRATAARPVARQRPAPTSRLRRSPAVAAPAGRGPAAAGSPDRRRPAGPRLRAQLDRYCDAAASLRVDAQGHGRLRVVGREHALPLARVVPLEPLDPPARVVPLRDRLALGGRNELVALAQETAQAGIDEARLGARARLALGGFDGLVDQREGFVGRTVRVPASASAVHSKASAAGGGVRLASWRRSASARPS